MIGTSYVLPLRRPTWRRSAKGPKESWAMLRKMGLTKRLTKVRKPLLSLLMRVAPVMNTATYPPVTYTPALLSLQPAHDDLNDRIRAFEGRRLASHLQQALYRIRQHAAKQRASRG